MKRVFVSVPEIVSFDVQLVKWLLRYLLLGEAVERRFD